MVAADRTLYGVRALLIDPLPLAAEVPDGLFVCVAEGAVVSEASLPKIRCGTGPGEAPCDLRYGLIACVLGGGVTGAFE